MQQNAYMEGFEADSVHFLESSSPKLPAWHPRYLEETILLIIHFVHSRSLLQQSRRLVSARLNVPSRTLECPLLSSVFELCLEELARLRVTLGKPEL